MKMKKFLCILLICALTIPAFILSVSAAVPYDNMIALYNMEGNLKNSVSGQEGTLKNGASFVNDAERGTVLYLNNDDVISPGQEGGYDTVGQWAMLAAPYVPDSDQMTVSIWLKLKERRNWARSIDIGDAKAQNNMDGGPDRFMNISPFAGTAGGEWFVGTVNANDGELGIPDNRDRIWAEPADENVWIHAVLVINKDGSTPNTLYVNGVPHLSAHSSPDDDPEPSEISPKHILAAPEGLRNVFLGRSAYENNGDQIFNGWIDDVVIFNVALTADQVAELNKADLSKGDPSKAAAAPEAPAEPAAPEVAPADAPVVDTAPAVVTPPPAPKPVAVKTGDAGIIVLAGIMMIAAAGVVVFKRKAVK